jgi:hypothetical protein
MRSEVQRFAKDAKLAGYLQKVSEPNNPCRGEHQQMEEHLLLGPQAGNGGLETEIASSSADCELVQEWLARPPSSDGRSGLRKRLPGLPAGWTNAKAENFVLRPGRVTQEQ